MPWFLWFILGIVTGGLIIAIAVILYILKIFDGM